MLVELPFAGFFLSKLLGTSADVDIHHLASLDPEVYKNLLFLKSYEGDVEELGLNFTVVNNELGEAQVSLTASFRPRGRGQLTHLCFLLCRIIHFILFELLHILVGRVTVADGSRGRVEGPGTLPTSGSQVGEHGSALWVIGYAPSVIGSTSSAMGSAPLVLGGPAR